MTRKWQQRKRVTANVMPPCSKRHRQENLPRTFSALGTLHRKRERLHRRILQLGTRTRWLGRRGRLQTVGLIPTQNDRRQVVLILKHALVLRGQTAFLPRRLSIGNYKHLLEKGSGPVGIGNSFLTPPRVLMNSFAHISAH